VPEVRHDWTADDVVEELSAPFSDLLARAHDLHRRWWEPNVVEAAALLSIKTGACPEDCAYCPQSASWLTGVEVQKLMDPEEVVAGARRAQAAGATRFCLGAAWRGPSDRQVAQVAAAVTEVSRLGMETCATLGMLTASQAAVLAEAGLDYYNHNLDTSPEFYPTIITTRAYQDRLDTLNHVRAAGIKVCCGGIVGMGESRTDRAGLLTQLATLDPHPESVPINLLIQVPGTPLYGAAPLDGLELVRTVAAARVLMPASVVRLSAGRTNMSDELQALCLHAGANSIFLCDRLLTAANPGDDHDRLLLARLGVRLSAEPLSPSVLSEQ
jgi:biotin synthase